MGLPNGLEGQVGFIGGGMMAEAIIKGILTKGVLKAGDIIPIKMPEFCTASIEDLPTYHGKLGRIKDNFALKISKILDRPDSGIGDIILLEDLKPEEKSSKK